jgi:hypothetical protein
MSDSFNGDFWLAVVTAGPVIAVGYAVSTGIAVARSDAAKQQDLPLGLRLANRRVAVVWTGGMMGTMLATWMALTALADKESKGEGLAGALIGASLGLLLYFGILDSYDKPPSGSSAE